MNQRMKKLNPRNISGFPGGTCGKESACQWRWPKSCAFDPRVGTIPWNRNGNLLRYSCLENPMDRGTWWITVHGAAKTQTQLSDWAHTAVVVVRSLSRVQLCNPMGCSMHWLYSKYKQKIITHHYSKSFYTALWLSGQSQTQTPQHGMWVKWKLLSRVQLFATPWAAARQAPLSMEFSRQESWSGLPFSSPNGMWGPS